MNLLRQKIMCTPNDAFNLWIFVRGLSYPQVYSAVGFIVDLMASSESVRLSPSFKQHISDLHVFFDVVLKVILSILIQSFINIKITFCIPQPLPPSPILLKAAFQRSDYHSCSNVSGCESRLILPGKWTNIAIKASPVSRTKGWRELGLPRCCLTQTAGDGVA